MELHNDCSFTSCIIYWNQDLFVSNFQSFSGSNLLVKVFFWLQALVQQLPCSEKKRQQRNLSHGEI